jgi:hypothetical protein
MARLHRPDAQPYVLLQHGHAAEPVDTADRGSGRSI